MYMDHIVNKENLDIVLKKIEIINYPGFNDISILRNLWTTIHFPHSHNVKSR